MYIRIQIAIYSIYLFLFLFSDEEYRIQHNLDKQTSLHNLYGINKVSFFYVSTFIKVINPQSITEGHRCSIQFYLIKMRILISINFQTWLKQKIFNINLFCPLKKNNFDFSMLKIATFLLCFTFLRFKNCIIIK